MELAFAGGFHQNFYPPDLKIARYPNSDWDATYRDALACTQEIRDGY
jgi:hypothetical protein